MERVRDWRRKGWTAERGGGPATRKDGDGAPAHGGNSNGSTDGLQRLRRRCGGVSNGAREQAAIQRRGGGVSADGQRRRAGRAVADRSARPAAVGVARPAA
ncbi:hypothetical protein Scep_021824 [Stephania cephalantha]|uniref:Uncharacterized protein n=1 Tax=Stephania cephalantha TaxID=152367 RepID=A0AAP0F458_9MAGN